MESPVKDVTFGEALKISLDHYYDLLKARAGDFDEKQFLQLQLASNIIDLSGESKKASEGGVPLELQVQFSADMRQINFSNSGRRSDRNKHQPIF